jgi:nitrite reductase/ring-hydroxylating ferredoxin subunit
MTDLHTVATGWTPVCPAEELAEPGSRRAIDLPSGVRCVVLNVDGELHALSAICPHRDLTLEGGVVLNGEIVCPWHKARFDVRSGQGTRPARWALRAFDVAVIDGNIHVYEKEDASS